MNSITICGNLTRDPEVRTTQSGRPMVTFGVADNRGRDKTIFFDCTAFDDVGQRILKFFKKGKPIFLSGPLDTREYTGRDGTQRTALQVTVTSWDFVSVGGRGENDGNGGGGGNTSGARAQAAPRRQDSPGFADEDAPPDFDLPDISDPFADQ